MGFRAAPEGLGSARYLERSRTGDRPQIRPGSESVGSQEIDADVVPLETVTDPRRARPVELVAGIAQRHREPPRRVGDDPDWQEDIEIQAQPRRYCATFEAV